MSNKNGTERINENTPISFEQTEQLVQRLVGNFKTKKLRPRRQSWGIEFLTSQRKDGRVRVGSPNKCGCGLAGELCGAFVKKAERGWTDYAAVKLRRAGFPVTKMFCDGFVEGFDFGPAKSEGEPGHHWNVGRAVGHTVATRLGL